MNNYLKNWQTTVSGIVLMGFGVALFTTGHNAEGAMSCVAGIGLLKAKAQNVTGVGDDAKTLKQIKKDDE